MDKKSKALLWVVALLIVGSVAVTYWRIVIKKDYIIENQTDCDPTNEKCFIWKCDPKSSVEGEACTGDSDKDTWYYQIAKRKAANVPLCDPDKDENCDPWTCTDGEKDCSTTFCDDTNKKEQKVECSDPVQYVIDNPVEENDEEGTVCEEGDTECETAAEASPEEATCEDGDTACEDDAAKADIACDPKTGDCAATDSNTDAEYPDSSDTTASQAQE